MNIVRYFLAALCCMQIAITHASQTSVTSVKKTAKRSAPVPIEQLEATNKKIFKRSEEQQEASLREILNQKLFRAAQQGTTKTIRSLFHGAVQPDINARDPLGRTPLMDAARRVKSDAVTALIELGADPSLSDMFGYTPLMEAMVNTNPELHDAQKEIIAALLATNADRDAQSRTGITALMVATLNNNYEAVSELLSVFADANLATDDGITPLMIAAREDEDGRLVAPLLIHGDPLLQDKLGKRASDYATNRKIKELVQMHEKRAEKLQALWKETKVTKSHL